MSEPSYHIRIGTSGYAFRDWVGTFYPPGTQERHMLQLYAEHFSVTELNYTWYQLPRADAVQRMLSKVPEGFDFTAKLTRTMTHEVDPTRWHDEVALYRAGVAPLIQARRLLAILVQLSPSFDRSRENRLHLAHLLDELEGLPLAVEFRHRSWVDDRVFQELEARHTTLVTVDAPDLTDLFPYLDVVTNPDLFYVRFHGRNLPGWRSGNMSKQFDYDYTGEELKVWSGKIIPKMATRARTGLVFFNNHVRGQAPQNARMLSQQLGLGDRASGLVAG